MQDGGAGEQEVVAGDGEVGAAHHEQHGGETRDGERRRPAGRRPREMPGPPSARAIDQASTIAQAR